MLIFLSSKVAKYNRVNASLVKSVHRYVKVRFEIKKCLNKYRVRTANKTPVKLHTHFTVLETVVRLRANILDET